MTTKTTKTTIKPQITDKPRLTWKQQRFIDEYITNNGNATLAARLAGYNGSDNYLAVVGGQNLRKYHIKAAIDEKKAELSKKSELTILSQQQAHARLARLAEEKGDLATATRNIELIGKTIGAYADVHEVRQVKPVERAEPAEEAAQLKSRLQLIEQMEAVPDCVQR